MLIPGVCNLGQTELPPVCVLANIRGAITRGAWHDLWLFLGPAVSRPCPACTEAALISFSLAQSVSHTHYFGQEQRREGKIEQINQSCQSQCEERPGSRYLWIGAKVSITRRVSQGTTLMFTGLREDSNSTIQLHASCPRQALVYKQLNRYQLCLTSLKQRHSKQFSAQRAVNVEGCAGDQAPLVQ